MEYQGPEERTARRGPRVVLDPPVRLELLD